MFIQSIIINIYKTAKSFFFSFTIDAVILVHEISPLINTEFVNVTFLWGCIQFHFTSAFNECSQILVIIHNS